MDAIFYILVFLNQVKNEWTMWILAGWGGVEEKKEKGVKESGEMKRGERNWVRNQEE